MYAVLVENRHLDWDWHPHTQQYQDKDAEGPEEGRGKRGDRVQARVPRRGEACFPAEIWLWGESYSSLVFV